MESYEPVVTPSYTPGDEVIFSAPCQGWEHALGTVERLVPIAPLAHQTSRYFYMLLLDDNSVVLATDEDLLPADAPRRARSA